MNTFSDAQENLWTPRKKAGKQEGKGKEGLCPRTGYCVCFFQLIPSEECAVVVVLDSRGHCLFMLKWWEKQAPLSSCSFLLCPAPGAMLGCCNLFPVQSFKLPEVDAHFHWAGQIGDKKSNPSVSHISMYFFCSSKACLQSLIVLGSVLENNKLVICNTAFWGMSVAAFTLSWSRNEHVLSTHSLQVLNIVSFMSIFRFPCLKDSP